MNKIALKSPPFLQKGDKIGIVSLASKIAKTDLLAGIAILQEQWGLEVVLGEAVFAEDNTFAGNDSTRLKGFQTMLDDASIKAVFAARGGYGSTRIIDDVDWKRFKKHPKWIVGFSDITAVHGCLQNLGYQSIHGPMPRGFGKPESQMAVAYLRQILFGETVLYLEKQSFAKQFQNRTGEVNAQIVGGNLCMLAHSIGSKSEIDTRGKILFIEDIEEYKYNIDRMLVQLQRAGKLKDLAGLIVGYFSDSKDGAVPFGKTESEIVAAHVAAFDFPVAYHFPIGHEDFNLAIPCGRVVQLKVSDFKTEIAF